MSDASFSKENESRSSLSDLVVAHPETLDLFLANRIQKIVNQEIAERTKFYTVIYLAVLGVVSTSVYGIGLYYLYDRANEDMQARTNQIASNVEDDLRRKANEAIEKSAIFQEMEDGKGKMVERLVAEITESAKQIAKLESDVTSVLQEMRNTKLAAEGLISALSTQRPKLEKLDQDVRQAIDDAGQKLTAAKLLVGGIESFAKETKGSDLERVKSILKLLHDEKYHETVFNRVAEMEVSIDKINARIQTVEQWPAKEIVRKTGSVTPGKETSILTAVSSSGMAMIHWEDGYHRTEVVLVNCPPYGHSGAIAVSWPGAQVFSGVEGDFTEVAYALQDKSKGLRSTELELMATVKRHPMKDGSADKQVKYQVTFFPF